MRVSRSMRIKLVAIVVIVVVFVLIVVVLVIVGIVVVELGTNRLRRILLFLWLCGRLCIGSRLSVGSGLGICSRFGISARLRVRTRFRVRARFRICTGRDWRRDRLRIDRSYRSWLRAVTVRAAVARRRRGRVATRSWSRARSRAWLRTATTTSEILGQLHFELHIFALEVVCRLHSELEFVINIEVDVVLFLLWEGLVAEHHPRGVGCLGRLLDRLLDDRFLDLWLLQVGEAAWHQVILVILLILALILVLLLLLLLSLLERRIVVLILHLGLVRVVVRLLVLLSGILPGIHLLLR